MEDEGAEPWWWERFPFRWVSLEGVSLERERERERERDRLRC